MAVRIYKFQRGLVISYQSLSKLFTKVRDRYRLSFILTHMLNQYGLEYFLAVFRQMGEATHDQANPVSVKYRTRSHLLGRERERFLDTTTTQIKKTGM